MIACICGELHYHVHVDGFHVSRYKTPQQLVKVAYTDQYVKQAGVLHHAWICVRIVTVGIGKIMRKCLSSNNRRHVGYSCY